MGKKQSRNQANDLQQQNYIEQQEHQEYESPQMNWYNEELSHNLEPQVQISPISQSNSRKTSTSSQKTLMSNKETNNITYSLKNREKLIVSAYRGDIHRVEEHLDNGFPLDFPLNESGWTLLHIAADQGNLELIDLLLDHGMDINQRETQQNWTPIIIATISRKLEAVALLKDRGADLDIKDKSNKTIFDLAKLYKCDKIEEFLSYS